MLKTRLTDLLGINDPIISAPMVRYSGAGLAVAVSSAGGLGTFGAASPTRAATPEYVREQIHLVRSGTDRPFGVGFITQAIPLFPESFEIVLEERVPVVLFSFADPRPYLRRAKDNGAIAICQVQTVEAAENAVDAGADVLVAQGNESGGHTGTMNLLPFLVRLVDMFPRVPVIASGGIAHPRSLAAVLAAGGEGAWIGTAFLATHEANEVADALKELIVKSSAEHTIYTPVFDIVAHARFKGAPWPAGIAARVLNNDFAREWHGREPELQNRLDQILPDYAEAVKRGDRRIIASFFGESASFVHDIRNAEDVIREICDGAESLLRRRTADLTS